MTNEFRIFVSGICSGIVIVASGGFVWWLGMKLRGEYIEFSVAKDIYGMPANKKERKRLLLEAKEQLLADSANDRDEAGLTLASLDDPVAIPWIEEAIAREENAMLKKDLQQVLDQLQATKDEYNDE